MRIAQLAELKAENHFLSDSKTFSLNYLYQG